MKTAIYTLFLSFILVACGKKAESNTETASAPSAAIPPAVESQWCGETILSVDGYAFQIDIQTGATTLLQDGPQQVMACQDWVCGPCEFWIVKGKPTESPPQ